MFIRHLIKLLEHEKLPYLVAVLAVILCLPALWTGFQMDDYFHRLPFKDENLMPDKVADTWDLFTFMDGNPDVTLRMIDFGTVPWWTNLEIRAQFWRPLSVLTHWIDYTFWYDWPMVMHLHSLLWFGVLVFIAALLYRQLLGPGWLAGLAALLFAVEDAHGWPAAWLANRNALLATLFGLLTLMIHDRYRRDDWKAGGVIAPFVLLCGLFSAEAAIATTAYLFAYALWLDEASLVRRFLSLVPYAAITITWWIMYHLQDFGTYGMELYLDPGSEPMKFMGAVLERGPMLFGAQFGFPPAFLYTFLSAEQIHTHWIVALCSSTLFFLTLLPLIIRDNLSRFFITGALISILPVCATFPHERLLMFVGFGALGLIARFLHSHLSQDNLLPKAKSWRIFAWIIAVYWILTHLVASPFFLSYSAWSPLVMEDLTVNTFDSLPEGPEISDNDLIIIRAPVPFFVAYMPLTRALNDKPHPRRMRILASGTEKVIVERPNATTLTITCPEGFIKAPFDSLFRGKAHPMKQGHTVELTGLTITVMSLTTDNSPRTVRFVFDLALEDEQFLWFKYMHNGYEHFAVPPVGTTKILPELTFDPLKEVF